MPLIAFICFLFLLHENLFIPSHGAMQEPKSQETSPINYMQQDEMKVNGKYSRRELQNSFHDVSHYALLPGKPRWPDTKLTYDFEDNTPALAIYAVEKALGTWASATKLEFSRAQNYNTSDLKFGFFSRDHGDGFPFDGPGGTLAHEFIPTDGRGHFDADESWSIGAAPDFFDVETVALQVIGHLLGLADSNVPEAVMYPDLRHNKRKVTLHADDIQGIHDLYGV